MSKFKGPMTAKELMDQLNKDPEYRRRRQEKDEKSRRIAEACDAFEQPLLDELRGLGFEGVSLSEIVKKYIPLPNDAVAVLLDGIGRSAETFIKDASIEDRVVEMWVRALGATADQFDGQVLVKCFERTDSDGLQFAILNTIAITKPHSINDWLEKAGQNEYLRGKLSDLGYIW